MSFSSKKSGFGHKNTKTKKKQSYTDQQLENIKFEALKMHQRNRFDKSEIAFKKLIKNGIKDPEILMNLYQIYKQSIRIKDCFIIYKKIIKETNISYSEITIDFLTFIINKEKKDFANEIVFGSLKENECNEKVISFYAKILLEKRDTNLAIDLLKKALEVNPISIILLSNMGYILQNLKRYKISIEYYKRALRLKSDDEIILFNIANCFEEIGDYQCAIKFYNKSILNNKNNPEALRALGTIYLNLKEYKKSINYFKKCLSINPNNSGALSSLMNIYADICEWAQVKKLFKEINYKKELHNEISPFLFLAIEDNPSNHLIRARETCQKRYDDKVQKLNKPNNKKIKIGYFSSDFHNHPAMQLMQKLFEFYSKNDFELFVYSYGNFKDEITAKIKENVCHFKDISLLSDEHIVSMAREDQLNIAIDLQGFTKNTRLSIFSRRIAPIQISYLGYPGTTGAKFMDYLIADRMLIPPGNEQFYSEKIIYMPDSYQCNDNSKIISDIKFKRKDFDLPEDGVIFTCFNNGFKITEKEFDLWMRLLKEIKSSHLWLFSTNLLMIKNLKDEAKKRNVDPNRISFAKKLPLEEHLARHSLGDIFLDTFNYNAHTTASDALWAGLPLLTLKGKSFSSRVASSLLNSLGLNELICSSEKEYFEKALDLGKNPSKIYLLKQKLFKNKLSYPLFDSRLFVKNYESQLKKVLESNSIS